MSLSILICIVLGKFFRAGGFILRTESVVSNIVGSEVDDADSIVYSNLDFSLDPTGLRSGVCAAVPLPLLILVGVL